MIDWDALVLGPNIATFGEPIAYVSQSAGPLDGITGIFDEAYRPVRPFGGSDVDEPLAIGMMGDTTSARPILGVQLSQFAAPPRQQDSVTIRGIDYLVANVETDSHGGAKLLLNEA